MPPPFCPIPPWSGWRPQRTACSTSAPWPRSRGITPVPFDDERMKDADGHLIDLDPSRTFVREDAARLGVAAGQVVESRVIREAAQLQAEGQALMWEYDGRQGELIAATQGLMEASRVERSLVSMRDNTRSAGAKTMALVAKPLFFVGDTSVIGTTLYLNGAPAFTAYATGLAAGAGSVFCGAMAGHAARVADRARPARPRSR